MNDRKKVAIGLVTAFVVLLAGGFGVVMKMGQAHERWHTCRKNCWLLDDAKRRCAEKRISQLLSYRVLTHIPMSLQAPGFTWGWR